MLTYVWKYTDLFKGMAHWMFPIKEKRKENQITGQNMK